MCYLVPVERFVHLLDLLAVEDLLHEAGPDVGGGPHTRGRNPGDKDGGGGPGGEGGQDAPGDGEPPADHAGAGPHGLAHPAPEPHAVQILGARPQLGDGVQPRFHQLTEIVVSL